MTGHLDVVVFDVQHGNATYIKTPNNKHIMIDLGTGETDGEVFSPLFYLKNELKIDGLDLVVITHPHRDHIDDIHNFDSLSPRFLYRPKHLTEKDIQDGNKSEEKEKRIIDKYLEIDAQYCEPVKPGERIQASENNGGVSIKHFVPKKCATSNLNNHSIVTVVSYAGCKIVIPGDNEGPSWLELLEDNAFMDAIQGTDIFFASHHGRESGYCKELFDLIEPSLIIISDGPASDTSISNSYFNVANDEGWSVTNISTGKSENRWVLTTRNDGHINIQIGFDKSGKSFMKISTSR